MAKDAKSKKFLKGLKKEGAKNTEAMGAFLGAKKYGMKKFQAKATKGKRKGK